MMHQLLRSKQHNNNGINPLCDYKGTDFIVACNSIIELFKDDCISSGIPELIESSCMDVVQTSLNEFISLTVKNMNRVKTSEQAASLADKMKEDQSIIKKLIQTIFCEIGSEEKGDIEGLFYTPGGCTGYSICSSCPYYLKSRVCIITLRYLFDQDESIQELSFNEKFYLRSSLKIAKCLLNIIHYIICNRDGDIKTLSKFKCLLEDVYSIMGIFSQMNPTGEEIRRQENNLLELLTRDRLPINDKERNYLYHILHEVFVDIESSNLPYVRDMQKAILVMRSELEKGYLESDLYLAMKSSPQQRKGSKKFKSLLNSLIERDTLKECPETIVFDTKFGYKSNYIIDTDTEPVCIKTKMIQNPGKFKLRGIHFAENAIQDRCSMIHRVIKVGLKALPEDASQDQEGRGRSYCKLCTLEWAMTDRYQKPGIYCLDFSNATDTMDQEFQNEILNFTLGQEVADYWALLSRTEKLFVFSDGSEDRYTQITGQPQGLLGSFDAFSLAHHFMMLMVMKMAGFEDKFAKDFYRVLGDDSLIYTIDPEFELLENNINILELYKRVCRFANFIINDDKGQYTFYHSDYALASFAKVEYMNGTNFSPTPYRLATNYLGSNVSLTQNGHISVAIWRTQTGYPGYQEFLEQTLSHFDNGKWIANVLQNGFFQSVSHNFINKNNLTDAQRGRIAYCMSASVLDSTMNSIFMGDKELSLKNPKSSRDSLEKIMKEGPSDDDWNKVPLDHKIYKVLEGNNQSDNFLTDLLSLKSSDERMIRICCELIEKNLSINAEGVEIDLNQFARIHSIIQRAVDNELVDVSEIFPEASLNLIPVLKEIKMGLMTRGLTKQPTRISYILQETFSLYKRVDTALGKLPEDEDLYNIT